MKYSVAVFVPLLVLAAANTPSREEVMERLTVIRSTQRGNMNIEAAEGEFLSGLVRQVRAKRVLEIGTSNGYSGIWLALGLRDTGGKLITLEIDNGRYSLAQENFRNTGVAPLIDSRLTDALQELEKIDGPFDMVFIDAWKPDYGKYLELVLPKVRSGGVITAHNVTSHPRDMQDFLARIRSDPQLKTGIVNLGSAKQGISVSWKK
ncbi:MAG: O-methyltransferase [Bryobacteraceae bacterium]|nr:O-methyltransferase [Bryobacteraceae bacterium]